MILIIINCFDCQLQGCEMNKIYQRLSVIALCCGLLSPSYARDVTDIVDDRQWSSQYRGGTGGSNFNMKNDLPNYFDTRVTKVAVRHGSRIDAVKFYWDYNSDNSATSSDFYGGSGGNLSSFSLSDDEHIVKIKIWGTDSDSDEGRVGRISFTTSDGDVYDYGSTAKNLKQWGAFSASQIIGLWGREGSEIDRAGIIIAPLVNLMVTDIELDNNSYKSTSNSSTFVSSQILYNDTSVAQSTQVSVVYTEASSFENSYSETAGITKTMGVEVETSGDLFGLAKVSTTISGSVSGQESLTIGESVSTSSSTSTWVKVDANVAAHTIVVAEAVAYYDTDEIDYTMTVENTYDGEEFEVKGTFTGEGTQVFGSWTEIGTINQGVIDVYSAFEDEYGYLEN